MKLVYLCFEVNGLTKETYKKPAGVELELEKNLWHYLGYTHKIGQGALTIGPKAAKCIGVFDEHTPLHLKQLEHTKELAQERLRASRD